MGGCADNAEAKPLRLPAKRALRDAEDGRNRPTGGEQMVSRTRHVMFPIGIGISRADTVNWVTDLPRAAEATIPSPQTARQACRAPLLPTKRRVGLVEKR